METVLEQFLNALDVKYTRSFARKLYMEHPHKQNMYGLKRMLDLYGLSSLGIFVDSKDVSVLNYPCIVHLSGDFVIATECEGESVTYLHNGRKIEIDVDRFQKSWSGNALVICESTDASEPNFKENRRKQFVSGLVNWSIPIMLLVVMGIGLFRNFVNMSILLCTQLVLNCVGILICGLLLEKQIFGISGYGDRVCSLFHHNDCNSVLDGKASKIFGFSWSEIGFGYFISSALLLAVYPSAQAIVSVLNWIAMIYGIWSVAYQWRKAKAWCALCLITQFLIWSAGISAGCEYFNSSLQFTFDGAMLSSIVYVLSIVLIHLLAKGFLSDRQKINAEQQYRALKANSDIAKLMLSKRDFFFTGIGDSSILFGNPDAGMKITILSNPHCNPCARMHKRVEKLLNFGNSEICVQYILSSFNETYMNGFRQRE